jgi:hypothetical protein
MGHLLLSHHLETLSQQQVLWPSVLGFSMDLVRAFIWPFTWVAASDASNAREASVASEHAGYDCEVVLMRRIFLGPAVNDALANVGRTGSKELADRYGEIGFQWVHEYEADLVGLR